MFPCEIMNINHSIEKIYTNYVEQVDDKQKIIAAVIGSWVVDGEAGGMGIRENVSNFVTDNKSRFVPHLIND